MGILNPNLKNDVIDAAIKDIRLAHPDMDLNATWALPKKWMSSRSLIPQSHKALGTILKALSTAKVKHIKINLKLFKILDFESRCATQGIATEIAADIGWQPTCCSETWSIRTRLHNTWKWQRFQFC